MTYYDTNVVYYHGIQTKEETIKLYSNIYIEPNSVRRIFGCRTLVIANNTRMAGSVFHNVQIFSRRKNFTSSISINYIKGEPIDKTYGLFYGTNIASVSGVKFQGKTVKNSLEYQIIVCILGATVKVGDTIWKLTDGIGWEKLTP